MIQIYSIHLVRFWWTWTAFTCFKGRLKCCVMKKRAVRNDPWGIRAHKQKLPLQGVPSCFFSTFSTSVTHGRLAKLFTNSRRGKRRARACEWRKQICVSMYINALFRRPQSNPLQISSNAHVMSGSFSLTCEATLVQSPRKGSQVEMATSFSKCYPCSQKGESSWNGNILL